MARVLLVNYAGYPYCPSSLMPDNGLATLAGVLRQNGHQARILDLATVSVLRRLYPEWISRRVNPIARALFEEDRRPRWWQLAQMGVLANVLDRHQARVVNELAREVVGEAREFHPDLVGFKLWNGDGFLGSVLMAKQLRRALPDVTVVAGGPQVDYFEHHILDYTDVFDYLAYGDGEDVIAPLVEVAAGRRAPADVPNLIYRRGGQTIKTARRAVQDLDGVAFPDYSTETYPAMTGDDKLKIVVINESRGCPFGCYFCIHPVKSGGVWREESPGRVVDEIEAVMGAVGTGLFVYAGSNTSTRVAMGIAREIMDRGLDIRYACFGHARGLSRADFHTLRRSGCLAVFYGLESGSQEILDRSMNKHLKVDEARNVMSECKREGIFTIASIIYPSPFETERSRAETLKLLLEVRPDSVPVTAPGLIPGTPWHTRAAEFGFQVEESPETWRYALTYKIKLLYPPKFWKRLPYSLNGMDSRTLLATSSEFSSELERNGILTNVPHEMVVMAEAAGMDARTFRNRCRTAFFSGDADAVAGMVSTINQAAAARCTRIKRSALPAAGFRAVPGA